MKPRFYKILIPAAIVGLAAFFFARNGGDPASPGINGAPQPEQKARALSRSEARAASKDESAPDAVLQRIPLQDRGNLWNGVAWNGQNPADFLSKEIGDKVTLDFGTGNPLAGKVIVKNQASGGTQTLGIAFANPDATLHIRVESNGSLFADLTPAHSASAYRWTGTTTASTFSRTTSDSVICSGVDEHGEAAVGMPPAPIPGGPGAKAGPLAAPVPTHNSRVGAKGCILLDFDGGTFSGTRWNTSYLTPVITAVAPNYTTAQMTGIWRVIAEDYQPFSVNVTTDEAVFNTYAKNRRMRVSFTADDNWFAVISGGAGGVAYLGSFSDGSDNPCWVFTDIVGDDYGAALAGSHEVGHTLGLNHDGLGTAEYYGVGNGAWGPIMGAPYGIQIVQWSNGDYTGATNKEDDLAIISNSQNGIGYVTDDFGNSAAAATNLGKNTLGSVSQSGLISTTADADYFSFSSTGGTCQLNVTSPSTSPNLNIQTTLYNAAGTVLATNNAAGTMSVSLSQVIAAGSYILKIEGAAEGTYDTGGYSDYGSLGPYTLTGTVPGLGAGIATITEPTLDAVSIREGNGLFLNATAPGVGTGSTILWKQLSGPVGGVTTFAPATTLATRATFSMTGLYTLQVQLTSNGTVSTDTVTVSVESITDPRAYPNLGPVVAVSSPTAYFSLDGDLIGNITDDGVPVSATPKARWDLLSGAATIESPNSSGTPIHFLAQGNCKVILSASDGQIRTFKELDLSASVRRVSAAVTGTTSKLLIPTNSAVDGSWMGLAFNDAAWISKPLAIGHGTGTVFKTALVGGSNIRTLLYNKGTGAYIRVPFQIRSKSFVGGLKLQMKFDDGFVMYLNGTEILRNNVPAGIPAWNTSASTKRLAANVAVPIEVDLSAYKSLLVDGGNVLAIHGVNFKKSDAEFLIAPNFEVQLIDTPYFRNVVEASALVPALVEPSADADGDGTSNLVEHALGLNPFTANAPVPVLTPDGAGAVKMTLPLFPPADVQYILERSYDLATWTPIATKSGTGAWSSSIVTVTTVSIASPLTTVRLLESSAPPSAVYRVRFVLSGPP